VSHHNYPRSALIPDYLRAGAGLLLSGGPLFLADPSSLMIYVLAGLAALFSLYGMRTMVRHMWRLEVTEKGVTAAGPFGGSVRWDELSALQLRYFSTRRDSTDGWMQLKLRGGESSLRIESALSDFAVVVARAAGEAERRGLTLNESTRANLATLDIGADATYREVSSRP
jgi:hypothetical protein